MSIYKFRIILDQEEDVIRDIAIESSTNLEDFHNTIYQAFGFEGGEMASFYTCDDSWNQLDEIPLFDTGDEPGEMRCMTDFSVEDLLYEKQTKIIYVYDFLNMWTFLVELAAIEESQVGETYPALLFAVGQIEQSANDVNFDFDDKAGEKYTNDGFSDDDFDLEDEDDIFGGDDSFGDFGYEGDYDY